MTVNIHPVLGGGTRLAGVCLAAAGAIVLFWLLYFSGALSFGQDDALRHSYEKAFPLADAVLAAVLLAAARAALLRAPRTGFLLAVAGAQALYLGVLDATFYLRHGLLLPAELLVCSLCVAGGLLALRHAARHWAAR